MTDHRRIVNDYLEELERARAPEQHYCRGCYKLYVADRDWVNAEWPRSTYCWDCRTRHN